MYIYKYSKHIYIYIQRAPTAPPLWGDDNNNNNKHQSLYLNATVFIHAEWLYAVRASSPNWWGKLFYKGLSVYPIPSYPAQLH